MKGVIKTVKVQHPTQGNRPPKSKGSVEAKHTSYTLLILISLLCLKKMKDSLKIKPKHNMIEETSGQAI